MIPKEVFVRTMERLTTLDKKMDTADKALKDLDLDFCGLYIPEVFDLAIDLLTEAMNDKHEWIKYFVYERDWLRGFKLGDIEVEDEPVKIYTWADVYDFIANIGEQA